VSDQFDQELFDTGIFDVRITVQVGPFAREITSPTRANGAIITLTRENWPAGDLFDWRVYERDRNGELKFLTGGHELGGFVPRRDGQPGEQPLVIQLSWPADRDKDRIRFEADVFQSFNTTPTIEWL
jgi:hypothetical protein